VNAARSPHIWKKVEGGWRLRNTVFGEPKTFTDGPGMH